MKAHKLSQQYRPLPERLFPVMVTVDLKDDQQVDNNKWRITIRQEPRIISMSRATWACLTMKEALASFNATEIKNVQIKDTKYDNSFIF
jgi:hypothetical protein